MVAEIPAKWDLENTLPLMVEIGITEMPDTPMKDHRVVNRNGANALRVDIIIPLVWDQTTALIAKAVLEENIEDRANTVNRAIVLLPQLGQPPQGLISTQGMKTGDGPENASPNLPS